jgi:DNA-binding response OmpR family regulator
LPGWLRQQALPDLVVTDIITPERDGIETMKEIRRRAPLAKILAMTGFRLDSSPEFPAMLRHLGADDVLTEPFGPELLLAKVDALLKRVPGDDGGWLTSP